VPESAGALEAQLSPASRGNPDTWLVIRVYNEAPVVRSVVLEALQHFGNVVCVDDASTDNSAEAILGTGAHLVRHPVNLGAGAALQTGIEYALRDPLMGQVVCFDGDGQHDIADAVRLAARLRSGDVDVVYGSRFLGRSEGIGRTRAHVLRWGRHFTTWTTGVRLTDPHNGLRGFSRSFAERVDLQLRDMAYASELVGLIAKDGTRYAEVPVTVRYTNHSRSKGQSSLNAVTIAFDVSMHQLAAGRR